MEGPVFRQLTQTEMIEILPRLQVLARSSPEDKKILVETLKMIGEIVGVTGDGTKDGPALETANIGFPMGVAGTEVAKEVSDIILMDDNSASIVKAIIWGRCISDSLSAYFCSPRFRPTSLRLSSPLFPPSLIPLCCPLSNCFGLTLSWTHSRLWLLRPTPLPRNSHFTVEMYKMILLQSVYQITVILVFHLLGLPSSD
jgi:Ca2+-transporting ATPase